MKTNKQHVFLIVLYLLSLQDQFAHADQVLGDFGETLFAFVSDESWPVDQILVDLFQSFLIVLTELHLQTCISGLSLSTKLAAGDTLGLYFCIYINKFTLWPTFSHNLAGNAALSITFM